MFTFFFPGKNSQIPLFFEIQVCVTWVWHRTRVSQKSPLGTRVYETRVPCDILPLCFKHFHYLFTIVDLSPIPRDPDKRKKKEKPTPERIRNKSESQWENYFPVFKQWEKKKN